MNIQELHTNEELRRREFPCTANGVFLAHAGVCPLPARVKKAMEDYLTRSTEGDQEMAWETGALQSARATAANLIGARPEEISFVGPTTLALNLVAQCLRFHRTSNVVIYHDDYPSNVYPWLRLADRGVEVRLLNIRQLGRIRPMDVLGQVDESTRLVALASCHFISGYRIDIDAIGRGLRERKILFCLDGIQTAGAFPTPVRNVDFMAADGHKWLLGPSAAGLLYIRKELQEHLEPPVVGWNNVECPDFVTQEELVFRTGPRRFEAGSHNLVGIAGLKASMELITELGIDNIAQVLREHRRFLLPALMELGFTVLQSDAGPENESGIVSFHRVGEDMGSIHAKLTDRGILTSLRADREGNKYIRLSPHFYNTREDLDRMVQALAAITR